MKFPGPPEQLSALFNRSLETGIFPSDWKSALVVPLFKGGTRDDVGNYRPVSLIPLPGNILEKIVHTKFSEFFKANDFLTEHQGFFLGRASLLPPQLQT